jgi:hypothetical protein
MQFAAVACALKTQTAIMRYKYKKGGASCQGCAAFFAWQSTIFGRHKFLTKKNRKTP